MPLEGVVKDLTQSLQLLQERISTLESSRQEITSGTTKGHFISCMY